MPSPAAFDGLVEKAAEAVVDAVKDGVSFPCPSTISATVLVR